jgi:hypothetical protein
MDTKDLIHYNNNFRYYFDIEYYNKRNKTNFHIDYIKEIFKEEYSKIIHINEWISSKLVWHNVIKKLKEIK